jgi:hypothetical protein
MNLRDYPPGAVFHTSSCPEITGHSAPSLPVLRAIADNPSHSGARAPAAAQTPLRTSSSNVSTTATTCTCRHPTGPATPAEHCAGRAVAPTVRPGQVSQACRGW